MNAPRMTTNQLYAFKDALNASLKPMGLAASVYYAGQAAPAEPVAWARNVHQEKLLLVIHIGKPPDVVKFADEVREWMDEYPDDELLICPSGAIKTL